MEKIENRLMFPPDKTGAPTGCMVINQRDMNKISKRPLGKKLTAQQLLNDASDAILTITAEPVALPPLCCDSPYVPRGAFQGDAVCVIPSHQSEAQMESDTKPSSYYGVGLDYTDYGITPNVPYGVCKLPLMYRQAYMGDYVCVSSAHQSHVRTDNAALASRFFYGSSELFPCGIVPAPLPGGVTR
jgi:hypothetical protein